MSWLLDTNILLRWAQSAHPLYSLVRQALARIHETREAVYITPQNLIEFWNVATRPIDRNGFGMSPMRAASEVGSSSRFSSWRLIRRKSTRNGGNWWRLRRFPEFKFMTHVSSWS